MFSHSQKGFLSKRRRWLWEFMGAQRVMIKVSKERENVDEIERAFQEAHTAIAKISGARKKSSYPQRPWDVTHSHWDLFVVVSLSLLGE